MNLEEVIRTRWAANGALEAALPVAKLTTGTFIAETPVFPYATMTLPTGAPGQRHNDGSALDQVTVRIAIYHGRDQFLACKAIGDAVRTAFDSTNFDLAGSDKVLDIRTNPPELINDQDDGQWVAVVDVNVVAFLAAGV